MAEEAGIVRLMVVRAQGYRGEVSVEWRTSDDTAKSSGKIPPDYAVSVIVVKMSHVMRKPVYAICEQQRRGPAYTSTQSGQHLRCLDSRISLVSISEIQASS